MMKSLTLVLLPVTAVLAASTAMPTMNMIDNAARPKVVCAPAGTTQKMVAVGSGELTYEFREKKDMADAFEWMLVGPVATLKTKSGEIVGNQRVLRRPDLEVG